LAIFTQNVYKHKVNKDFSLDDRTSYESIRNKITSHILPKNVIKAVISKTSDKTKNPITRQH